MSFIGSPLLLNADVGFFARLIYLELLEKDSIPDNANSTTLDTNFPTRALIL